MDWTPHAERLADASVHPVSRWHPLVARTPRHVFTPRWWVGEGNGWALRDGPSDEQAWLTAAYANRSLVTSVAGWHADQAARGDAPTGLPTSSSTLPGLVVNMLRHGMIADDMRLAIVGAGTGYSSALAAKRLGEERVTAFEVDPYAAKAATERLAEIDLHPQVITADATGSLPSSYDRIVSMVGVPRIPASWLDALRPGGRLVTTIAGMGIIITADKDQEGGGATGRVEWDRAGFMATRYDGGDYPAPLDSVFAHHQDGEQVGPGRYPVIAVMESWELWSVLQLAAPGIQHHYSEADGVRTAVMVHADGSWARATGRRGETPQVHQGGPRRLWDELDRIRDEWEAEGYLQLYGAKAIIRPDGTCHLVRGRWRALIA